MKVFLTGKKHIGKSSVIDRFLEETGVSAILRTLSDDVEQRGDGVICTCAQAVNSLYRDGSFLLRALELTDSAEEGVKTAAFNGYAVINNGKLAAYIDRDDALAVTFLQNKAGVSGIDIEGAALEISGGEVKISPVREDGELSAIDFELNVSAAVAESSGDSIDPDALARGLEDELVRRTENVLRLMKRTRADFLGLGAKLGISPEELMQAQYRVTVTAQITHSYDLSEGEAIRY